MVSKDVTDQTASDLSGGPMERLQLDEGKPENSQVHSLGWDAQGKVEDSRCDGCSNEHQRKGR